MAATIREIKAEVGEQLVNKANMATCAICQRMKLEAEKIVDGERYYVKCTNCRSKFLARLWPTSDNVALTKERSVALIWQQMVKWLRFHVWAGERNHVDKIGLTKDARGKLSEVHKFILNNNLDLHIEDVGEHAVKYLFGISTYELSEEEQNKLDEFGKKFTAYESHDPRYIKIQRSWM